MSWKIFFGAFILLLVIGAFVGLNGDRSNQTQNHSVNVVASFYPLAEFARQVGGTAIEVVSITPAGVEPHDFEPTPQQVASMYNADLFIYNGAGVDTWAQALAADIKRQGGAVLEMSQLLQTHWKNQETEETDVEGEIDPHFWLNPVFAKQQVMAIRDLLIQVDPINTQTYREQADRYLDELVALDREYRVGLKTCDLPTVVTSHAAFGYVAREYGFEQLSITGLSPDQEPSAGALADLAREATRRQIQYVFFETLVSPELAQTLASEIGAQTLVFNPLEGLTPEETAAGKNYLSVMRDNLQNLRTAMLCQ